MKIYIENFHFRCIIGLLEHEKKVPQKIIVNVELDYKHTKDFFINYADLAQLIKKNLQKNRYELLETAIEDLFSIILKEYPSTKSIFIKITKPDILKNSYVSVSNIKKF